MKLFESGLDFDSLFSPIENSNNTYFGNNCLFYGDNDFFQREFSLEQKNNSLQNNLYDCLPEFQNEISQINTLGTLGAIHNGSKILVKKDINNFEKEPILTHFNVIEDIIENGPYKNKFSDNVKKIQINDNIKNAEKQMEFYKRKSKLNSDKDNSFVNMENQKEYCRKKRGRKSPKNSANNKVGHNKMSPDNVIKKIKAQIFEYPINFLNNISNKNNSDKKYQILKLDYKYIDRVKRELDLKYLNTPLKNLFSMDVSPKCKNIGKDYKESNKKIIENILNLEADDTIMFAFNMTFRDWIDLFTYKKNIKDIINSYDLTNYKDIDTKRIEDCMVGVEVLLNDMSKAEENDNHYFSYFIFYLYNYERWFFLKKGRNRNNNKNK